jgi:hypothetical protein
MHDSVSGMAYVNSEKCSWWWVYKFGGLLNLAPLKSGRARFLSQQQSFRINTMYKPYFIKSQAKKLFIVGI